jgi:hypothetical protein
MQLNVGVLIIGSLYWDTTGGRDNWRTESLQKDRDWCEGGSIAPGRFPWLTVLYEPADI